MLDPAAAGASARSSLVWKADDPRVYDEAEVSAAVAAVRDAMRSPEEVVRGSPKMVVAVATVAVTN